MKIRMFKLLFIVCITLVLLSCVSAEGLFSRIFSMFSSPQKASPTHKEAGQVNELATSQQVTEVTPISEDSKDAISESSKPDVALSLAAARQLVEQGQYRSAVERYLAILELDPINVEGSGSLGAVLLLLNEPSMAEGFLYTSVRESNWSDFYAINNLAECLRLNGNLELAEKVALRGFSSDPQKDPTGLISYTIGNIYFSQQKFNLATDWYLAAAVKQSSPDIWIKASTLQFPLNHHDYRVAENSLLEGIKRFPDNAKMYFHLGVAMYNTQRFKESIPLFEQALLLDPEYSQAAQSLQVAKKQIENSAKADFRLFQQGL